MESALDEHGNVIIAVYSSTVLMVQRDDGASCQVLFEDAIAEGAPQ